MIKRFDIIDYPSFIYIFKKKYYTYKGDIDIVNLAKFAIKGFEEDEGENIASVLVAENSNYSQTIFNIIKGKWNNLRIQKSHYQIIISSIIISAIIAYFCSIYIINHFHNKHKFE